MNRYGRIYTNFLKLVLPLSYEKGPVNVRNAVKNKVFIVEMIFFYFLEKLRSLIIINKIHPVYT